MKSRKELLETELPKSLREIKELIGLSQALEIVKRYGGIRLFVPKRLPEDHPLVTILGQEAACSMSSRYGGDILTIPRATRAMRVLRNHEIAARYDKGTPVRILAQNYRLTERQIYSILSVMG